MTFEAHKQEPAAAKDRPWLDGVYSDDLLDWTESRLEETPGAERASSTITMLQFHKQVQYHAPLSTAYIPSLQWIMDFFRRDTYNAGMYGSVNKFLDDLTDEAIKHGSILNAYAQAPRSPAIWSAVNWRTDEIYKYGDKFLEGMQPGDASKGLIVAGGMARSGLASEEWLISFWEHFKTNIDRTSSARRLTVKDWEEILPALASAPNLPEYVVREMMERMLAHETSFGIRNNLMDSLLWNENVLTADIYMEFLGEGSKGSIRWGTEAEAVPYHGTRSLEELRKMSGLKPDTKSRKMGTLYEKLNQRLGQGAIWKKSVQKIRNSDPLLGLYGGLSNSWAYSDTQPVRTGSYVRIGRISDHVYLAREGKFLREQIATQQLGEPRWKSGRVIALPAVGERLRTVRSTAVSSGLDEEGNIPLEWILEIL